MDPVKIAVLGGGTIGGRHIRIAVSEPDCELVAIVDPDPAIGALADETGVRYFTDLRTMLSAVQPEGVIIAVPTGQHFDIGMACIERGIHMLMEKPITGTVEEGRALFNAAEAAGVRIATGHHRRFDPAVEGARTIIQRGDLGRLVAISVIWFVRKPDIYFEPLWRQKKGAGPILTNLIHDIDLLRYVCGEIESVYAETSGVARGYDVEDTAAMVLRFRGGALATVTLSDATPSPWGWEQGTNDNPYITATGEDCYFFAGSEASLAFPSLDIWSHPNRYIDGWGDPINKVPQPQRERRALADQLRHFCRVVRGDEMPRVSGADSLAILAATAAIFESAEQGIPIAPSLIVPRGTIC